MPKMINEAYERGRKDFKAGARQSDNPFFDRSMYFASWNQGWFDSRCEDLPIDQPTDIPDNYEDFLFVE